MELTPVEARRKLVHISVGGFALLLRFMTWRQAALMAMAAFFFNWHALPRLGGRGLWRSAALRRLAHRAGAPPPPPQRASRTSLPSPISLAAPAAGLAPPLGRAR